MYIPPTSPFVLKENTLRFCVIACFFFLFFLFCFLFFLFCFSEPPPKKKKKPDPAEVLRTGEVPIEAAPEDPKVPQAFLDAAPEIPEEAELEEVVELD